MFRFGSFQRFNAQDLMFWGQNLDPIIDSSNFYKEGVCPDDLSFQFAVFSQR